MWCNIYIYIYLFIFVLDVFEGLTEVDEKSKRNPEIIQYFVVSTFHNPHKIAQLKEIS